MRAVVSLAAAVGDVPKHGSGAMMAAKQKVPPRIVKVMAATVVLTFMTLVLGYHLLF